MSSMGTSEVATWTTLSAQTTAGADLYSLPNEQQYTLGATALDCSIMLTFQRIPSTSVMPIDDRSRYTSLSYFYYYKYTYYTYITYL